MFNMEYERHSKILIKVPPENISSIFGKSDHHIIAIGTQESC